MTETRFPTGISGKKNDDLDIWSDSDIALYPQGHIWISQGTKLIFEGTIPDDYEIKLQATSATADRDIILPDASGTIALLTSLSVGAEGVASGDGSIAYNNTSGVFTYTPPTPSGIGAATLTSFSVGAEGVASGDGSIAYNNTTGVFTYTPPDLSSYLTAVPANISVTTASISSTLSLTLLNAAPVSPANGMIAASNGTGWDPASDGLHHINAYLNGVWVQIA
jgi:hypothetical protein